MSVLYEVPFYYKISIYDIMNYIFDSTTSIFLISQNELEFLISRNRFCDITNSR